ncbi:hypothetical protein NQ315_003437 [Exocentrus adspersus]|uniref:Prokaryotic-type class I peptide chain release factors domain-containing protein n=1 Tax=Exocentrus adspersus TaxID=1586481 RepID=A0AAV8VN44_9CUCU|nr:hypothetical protein NQ315_003437 [Exocentrus adspersus]
MRRTTMSYLRTFTTCLKKYKVLTRGYSRGNILCSPRYYSSGCPRPKYDVDLKINGVSLTSYITKLVKEYEQISEDKNFSSNPRWRELHSVVQILEVYQMSVDSIDNLKELLQENDTEMRKLAEEEKHELGLKIKEIEEQLIEALMPISEEDSCNAIVLEVQAGVGGQEAMLFAKEIFDMYCSFAEFKGWELQVAEYPTTDIGGVRRAVALISGPSVFHYFKHEVGIHRVQRTPVTEKTGRVHTSTASVTALPQPTDIQININPKDLKIETKRSTGAGGQHVNTTDSAVRITHLPTGTVVDCQVDRSQIKNRKIAMARLNAILFEKELNNQIAESQATRKSQVRSKNRNEKIRTYNYNQNRITDHRLSGYNIHNLESFFEGGEPLDKLIRNLEKQHKIEGLLDIISYSNKLCDDDNDNK